MQTIRLTIQSKPKTFFDEVAAFQQTDEVLKQIPYKVLRSKPRYKCGAVLTKAYLHRNKTVTANSRQEIFSGFTRLPDKCNIPASDYL